MIFAVLPPPMTKTKRKGINMKAKKHGTAVIFFETDLEKSTPFDEDSLSDLQKRTLSEMPKAEQEKIKVRVSLISAAGAAFATSTPKDTDRRNMSLSRLPKCSFRG